MTNDSEGIDQIAPVSAAQTDALSRLLAAATDLVNAKLSADLAGTDFHGALRAGHASIELAIELPSGNLKVRAVYPAMGRKPLELFEVKVPRVRLS